MFLAFLSIFKSLEMVSSICTRPESVTHRFQIVMASFEPAWALQRWPDCQRGVRHNPAFRRYYTVPESFSDVTQLFLDGVQELLDRHFRSGVIVYHSCGTGIAACELDVAS